MTAANSLLQAIFARLSADAALSALVGAGGFYDRLLDRTAMPYLVLGALDSRDYSTASEAGEEHFLTLAIWSDGQGQKQAQTIAARVRALLHDQPLVLDGAVLVSLLHRNTRSRREPKSRCHVAEMRFRAVTE